MGSPLARGLRDTLLSHTLSVSLSLCVCPILIDIYFQGREREIERSLSLSLPLVLRFAADRILFRLGGPRHSGESFFALAAGAERRCVRIYVLYVCVPVRCLGEYTRPIEIFLECIHIK